MRQHLFLRWNSMSVGMRVIRNDLLQQQCQGIVMRMRITIRGNGF
jgi:hypothetical protein